MIGVVYRFDTQLIQRIVVPDRDSELNTQVLQAGEGMFRIAKSAYNLFHSQQQLAESLGLVG